MKKYLIPLILILLGVVVYFSTITMPDCENAEIICVDKTKSVITNVVSKEDTETLKAIFSSNCTPLHFDSPACGFSGNYCVKIGWETYYPACDSCPTIGYKARCFNISEKDKDKVRELMKKYGAEYPYM